MTEHETGFTFKARYYKLGEINASTRQVWFVLHGYGQLARFFIKKFGALSAQDIVVIAPEGLSRFYLEDTALRMQTGNNRVGATWMTREDREVDIENYLQYLQTVYDKEKSVINGLPVTLLGFSQGAATASRWATSGLIPFERLILWAGIFPPDLDFNAGKQSFERKRIVSVVGRKDPFLTPERVTEMEALSEKLGIKPEQVFFDGEHGIDESVLTNLARD